MSGTENTSQLFLGALSSLFIVCAIPERVSSAVLVQQAREPAIIEPITAQTVGSTQQGPTVVEHIENSPVKRFPTVAAYVDPEDGMGSRKAEVEEEGYEEDEEDEDDEYEEDGDDEYVDDEEEVFPRLEIGIGAEFEQDYTLESDDEDQEDTPAFISAYSYFDLYLNPSFYLELGLSYDTSGRDVRHVLSEKGLYVDAIFASYSAEMAGIYVGKLNLLGDIWDRGSTGIFDSFQTSDLDLSSVIGIQTWLNVSPSAESDHYLSVGAFFRDTTPLSGELFANEGRLSKEDGGLANTEKLNNIMVSLYGDELPYFPNWEYSIGFVHQFAGKGDSNNERSYFSGLYGEYDLLDDYTIYPFLELLRRHGADGEDQTATTVSFGSSIYKNSWSFGVSYAFRDTHSFDVADPEDSWDNNLQLFAGYTFESGLYVEAGYQYLKEFDEDSHSIGMAIGYPWEFAFTPGAKARVEPPTEAEQARIRRQLRR